MIVASIQFCPEFKNKTSNLLRLTKLVVEAASKGAKLIVLPELAATGYTFMSEDEARPFAECPQWLDDTMSEDSAMYVFSSLSKKLDVCIVFGFIELDPGTKKLYNSQIYIEPDGYYDSYRKINPWGNDYLWAARGKSNPPVIKCSHSGDRVGLLICRDVRDKKNEEWSNFYSPGDADIVALSTNWGDGGFPAVSWIDFAEENKVTLIVSNRYGQEGPNDFGEGGICIIEKTGKVHCEGLKWSQDCIVYAEV